MKILFTLAAAVALCSPAALAIHAPSEKPFATSVEEASGLIDSAIAAFNDLISTYEGIKDTASANAAAEKLPALHMNLQTAVDKVNAIGEADEATQNLFMTRLMPMLFVFGGRSNAAFERIKENNYYDSDELRAFMGQILPQG